MSRNEGAKYDLVSGDVLLVFDTASREGRPRWLPIEGADSDSSCIDSLDFINTHLIRAISDILGILDFGYQK